MKCSRCSVAEISPLTGACELCGFVSGTTVAVEHADALVELATKQLTHEFEFLTPIAISQVASSPQRTVWRIGSRDNAMPCRIRPMTNWSR